jgi:hypothetical protein
MITIDEFTGREVIYAVSTLISDLGKMRDEAMDEDLLTLQMGREDYEEAATQDGAKLHFREDDGNWCVLDQNDNDMWDELFPSA